VKCLMYFEPSGISNCDTNNIASSTAFRINTKDINKMKAMRLTSLLFAATQTRLGLADPEVVGPGEELTKWFSIELDDGLEERLCLHHTGDGRKVELMKCLLEGEEITKEQLWRSLPHGALQSKNGLKKGTGRQKACLVMPKKGESVNVKKCPRKHKKSYVWTYDPFFRKLIHAGVQKVGKKKQFCGALTLEEKLITKEYMQNSIPRENSWILVNHGSTTT